MARDGLQGAAEAWSALEPEGQRVRQRVAAGFEEPEEEVRIAVAVSLVRSSGYADGRDGDIARV